jgi:hypothetical protein
MTAIGFYAPPKRRTPCCGNCQHWSKEQDSRSIVEVPMGDEDKFAHLEGWCQITSLGKAFRTEEVISKAIAFDVDGYDSCLKTTEDFYCNQYRLLQ